MSGEHFENIKTGLEDAIAYMQGDHTRGTAYKIPCLDIKELRRQLGLTQNQLARVIGTTSQSTAAWEQSNNSCYASY